MRHHLSLKNFFNSKFFAVSLVFLHINIYIYRSNYFIIFLTHFYPFKNIKNNKNYLVFEFFKINLLLSFYIPVHKFSFLQDTAFYIWQELLKIHTLHLWNRIIYILEHSWNINKKCFIKNTSFSFLFSIAYFWKTRKIIIAKINVQIASTLYKLITDI